MRTVETDALVLHTFDYRETSRIVRLATRDAGTISAIARGARRAKSRFGNALDLFTSGVAQLSLNPSRDLQTLTAFDATAARPRLASSLERFGAASAIAELCIRFGGEGDGGQVHDAAVSALDGIVGSEPKAVAGAALAGAWRLIAELGFAPALEECASCHAALAPTADVTFQHRAGGALCARCAKLARGGRRLPADARRTLIAWLAGTEDAVPRPAARSHLRLLREFLEEHLADGRPLRALMSWEELPE